MGFLERMDAARTVSAAAIAIALLVLAGFLTAALRGGVHAEAWAAAVAVPVMAGSGLLYAWRLGAYGASR